MSLIVVNLNQCLLGLDATRCNLRPTHVPERIPMIDCRLLQIQVGIYIVDGVPKNDAQT